VARTIDEKYPTLKEAHPEVLARHWTEAGETEPAIIEWSRAGKIAEARNAFKEAQESYQQALELLNLLPESSERDLRELELRQSVVRTLFITIGYSAPQTIEATERAATLAEKSGNLRQLVNLLVARGISSVIAGDLPAASSLADRALELALREGSPSILGRMHLLEMMARYYRGDLVGAERHFIAGLESFDHPSFRRIPGVAVAAFNYASCNAWMLGHADVAHERMARMMAVANESNPYEVAFSARFAAELRSSMREYEQAEALAARALELSEKHQFVSLVVGCRLVIGRARAQLGRSTEDIGLIRQGIAGMAEIGERLGIAAWMTALAEALQRAGAVVEALETIEQAFQASSELAVFRPEMLRRRGELRLKQGQTELAEADFREAIELAHSMGAKVLELRATISLARQLEKQGERDEARMMLAEIYNWFTEGFDTADLKDAKVLLDELNG
jgi:tetratricopeptide (TPR) repeat protein